MDKLKFYFSKYKQFLAYAFFGGCTTLINIICYFIFAHILNFSTTVSNCMAWVFSCLFAYLTNRKWVFNSNVKSKLGLFKEVLSFYSCRLATGIFDVVFMWLFVDVMNVNDLIIKVISNVIVIILNFVASKLIIFKEGNKINIKKYILYFVLFILCFIFLLSSPLNPFHVPESATDSSVFRTIGFMMTKGYTPYLDIFDHKGPLLYFINYLGQLLFFNRGVWLLELFSLYITSLILYKTCNLYVSKNKSIFIIFLVLSMLFPYFEGGNLTEEWALPFIALGQYIFFKYFKEKKISNLLIIACGMCMGAVCLIRINMIVLWFVFCIYVFIDAIVKKNIKELFKFITLFIIGLVISILPFIIWLNIKGALHAFINDYIYFNLSYCSKGSSNAILFNRLRTIIYFASDKLIISSILIMLYYIAKKKDTIFNTIYVIYLCILLYFISMSGVEYAHYGIILVTSIVYPLSYLLKNMNNNSQTLKVIALLIIVNFTSLYWIGDIKNVIITYNNKYNYSNYINILNDYIIANTKEDDKIVIYNNVNIIYLKSKRIPGSMYSYVIDDKKVLNRICRDIDKNNIKLVISNVNFEDIKFKKLMKKKYKLEDTVENTYNVYILKK